MKLIPHSEEWYEWMYHKQEGYFYPWGKILSPWHGDDNFRALVFEHLRPEMDVLEVACAQGDLALEMAAKARSVLGYDAVPAYIDLARQAAARSGVSNVTFLTHNSRAQFNGGQARVPAADHSIDLWVNSLGPFHPLADAPRVCRPGAVILQLVAGGGVPGGGGGPAPWNDLLPEALRLPPMAGRANPNWAYQSFTQNLAEVGLQLHSWWDFDVPVYTPTPEDLHASLTWALMEDEAPPYAAVEADLTRIFKEFAGPQGLEGRWRRSIGKAMIPE